MNVDLAEFDLIRIPGHTCPDINEAIQRVSDAEIDARFALRQGRGYEQALRDIIRELSKIEPLLEKLRKQNDQLRTVAEMGKKLLELEPYEKESCPAKSEAT